MLEELSEEVHNIWCRWAKSIIKSENLSQERIKRWKKCFVPYQNLTNEMKEKDRKIAIQILTLIKEK